MQITVHLLAFGNDVPIPTRIVDIPEGFPVCETPEQAIAAALDRVYYYGQNDFQPKPCRSVSVGDVIEFPAGDLHRVLGFGFERLPEGVDLSTLERGIACSLLH